MMMLASFEALLQAAREQPEGQRFLLVFVKTALPDGANPAQAERFERGRGGALVPVMYVDKGQDELVDFDGLVAEAQRTGNTLGEDSAGNWDMVVVGCLGGYGSREPTSKEAEAPLNDLLRTIRTGGSLMHLAVFDRHGDPVSIQ